jgi:transcriptional regulator with XRE-family HTH domain
MAMTIYEIFATNLRSQCLRFDSIAEVCRGIEINRQQFNKYLAGQILPNAQTMRRICSFLKVNEEVLFQSNNVPSSVSLRQQTGKQFSTRNMLNLYEVLETKFKFDPSAVKEGYYYCYFPQQSFANFLIRSIIKVSNKEGICSFARLTVVPTSNRPRAFSTRGKHHGLIFANAQEIYLLGMNVGSANHISLITIDRSYTASGRLLQGMALLRGANSQFACRAALEFLGAKIDLKQAMKTLGQLELNDPSISAKVVAAMRSWPSAKDSQMSNHDVEELLFRSKMHSEPS